MKFIPDAIRRTIANQALLSKKNAPTILFGTGIASMVGSTVLACRATLKVEGVLAEIEHNKQKTVTAKEYIESGEASEGLTYTDSELRKDLAIIYTRGAVKMVKLYAPAAILGGIGVVCLTKSHQILKERNMALTAAYIAVDTAFKRYRERVVDRYGEETDRDLRYDNEDVDIIDDETGKLVSTSKVVEGDQGCTHAGSTRRTATGVLLRWTSTTGSSCVLSRTGPTINCAAGGISSSTKCMPCSVWLIPQPELSSVGSTIATTKWVTTTPTSVAGISRPANHSPSSTAEKARFCSISTSMAPSGN
jgi:hypothetical protein